MGWPALRHVAVNLVKFIIMHQRTEIHRNSSNISHILPLSLLETIAIRLDAIIYRLVVLPAKFILPE